MDADRAVGDSPSNVLATPPLSRMVYHLVTDKSLVMVMRMFSQGVRILSSMVLARYVVAEEFGRFELIISFAGLLASASDLGITRSISASHDLPEHEVQDTSLIMMLTLASIYAVFVMIGGWYFDISRDDPRLRWVGFIIGINCLVQYTQATQSALLARELRFLRWAWVEALTIIATVATGIGIAVAGGGIFALAIQQLMAQLVALGITIRYKPLRWPRLWNGAIAKRFLSFGWKLSLYQYITAVQPNISRQTIGRWAGDAMLGNFGRATQIRELIGQNLASTFDLILMPLFARAQQDFHRLRDLLIRGTMGITAFCAFGAAWLAASSTDLIRVFLGSNWPEVPELLQALAPGLAFQGLGYACVILSFALNRPFVTIRYSLLQFVGLVVSIIVFWFTDVWHFALIQSVWTIVPVIYILNWGTRTVGLRRLTLIRRMGPILIEAIILFVVVQLTRNAIIRLESHFAMEQLTPWTWLHPELFWAIVRLTLASLCSATTIVAILLLIDRSNLKDMLGLVLRPKPVVQPIPEL